MEVKYHLQALIAGNFRIGDGLTIDQTITIRGRDFAQSNPYNHTTDISIEIIWQSHQSINCFFAVPVSPGLQKLQRSYRYICPIIVYTGSKCRTVTYPTVTFIQKRTSRSTGNTRDIRVIKDAEILKMTVI